MQAAAPPPLRSDPSSTWQHPAAPDGPHTTRHVPLQLQHLRTFFRNSASSGYSLSRSGEGPHGACRSGQVAAAAPAAAPTALPPPTAPASCVRSCAISLCASSRSRISRWTWARVMDLLPPPPPPPSPLLPPEPLKRQEATNRPTDTPSTRESMRGPRLAAPLLGPLACAIPGLQGLLQRSSGQQGGQGRVLEPHQASFYAPVPNVPVLGYSI